MKFVPKASEELLMKRFISLFLLLFLAACGDDNNDVGTTPQDNCILRGLPSNCNSSQFGFTQGHYPINNAGYWQGFNNGGFNHLGGCHNNFGNSFMVAGHPSGGLHCTPRINANFHRINFQSFQIPQSCRTNAHCGGNAICRVQYSNYAGVCVYR